MNNTEKLHKIDQFFPEDDIEKEFTFKEICEILNWNPDTKGNSKKAQVKELDRCFTYYHPINPKTGKKKRTYIFTDQIYNPITPSRKYNKSHNTKNIDLMKEYLSTFSFIKKNNEFHYPIPTKWFIDILQLGNKGYEKCFIFDPYFNEFCSTLKVEKGLIKNYTFYLKNEFNDLLLKTLNRMNQDEGYLYELGYTFEFDFSNSFWGYIATSELNDIIYENEIRICNRLNDLYHINPKKSGKSLMFNIMMNTKYSQKYAEAKLAYIKQSPEYLEAIKKEIILTNTFTLNKNISTTDYGSLDLKSYFKSLKICGNIGKYDKEKRIYYGNKICDLLHEKTIQRLKNKYYVNKLLGTKVYLTSKTGQLDIIRDHLFNPLYL